jgi:hypothetical protein
LGEERGFTAEAQRAQRAQRIKILRKDWKNLRILIPDVSIGNLPR